MEPILGQICLFGFNFAPRGWAFCNGQLLSIAQNTALFSLLGTTYGGDGVTTFGLPDLRGRAAVQFGQSPGLSQYDLGERGGAETTTLTLANMPAHTHPVNVPTTDSPAGTDDPNGTILANGGTAIYGAVNEGNGSYGGITSGIVGSNMPFSIQSPYLALNYCIALQGIYPSRQ